MSRTPRRWPLTFALAATLATPGQAAKDVNLKAWITGPVRYIAEAEEALPQLLDRFDANQTTALLDPPRKGCLPVTLQTLLRVAPRQIIYVSCHPATMARDLKILCDGHYTLERVVPLDMFPQTQHVECVADLRRTGRPSPGE